MNAAEFSVITFDCYGTLIDWESGILACMLPLVERHGVTISTGDLLRAYARAESAVESGAFVNYREVLRRTMSAMSHDIGFSVDIHESETLLRSLPSWPPFPDSVAALKRLATRFRLGLISNVDDGLLRSSLTQLQSSFAFVVTSERARAYKPDVRPFELALGEVGCASDRVLHVAQSRYHDIAPARSLGLTCVHVMRGNRPADERANLPSTAQADLEVDSLAELADRLGV